MLQGWNAVFDQIAASAALGLYGRWRFPGALSAVEASHAELWYHTLRATGQNTQVAHLHTFLAMSHRNLQCHGYRWALSGQRGIGCPRTRVLDGYEPPCMLGIALGTPGRAVSDLSH